MPESNIPDGALGVPLVTVCGIWLVSLFIHMTVVPAWTVMLLGLKAIFWIETITVPFGAGVVDGAGCGAGAGVIPCMGTVGAA